MKCKYCNSNTINKNRIIKSKQRYLCRDCKKTFIEGIGRIIKETIIKE